MKIIVKKTKVMVISRKGGGVVKITLNGERIEQVAKFCYLGAWITEDGRCDTEIRSRIALAKAAFNRRNELLTNNESECEEKDCESSCLECVLVWFGNMDCEF